MRSKVVLLLEPALVCNASGSVHVLDALADPCHEVPCCLGSSPEEDPWGDICEQKQDLPQPSNNGHTALLHTDSAASACSALWWTLLMRSLAPGAAVQRGNPINSSSSSSSRCLSAIHRSPAAPLSSRQCLRHPWKPGGPC